MTENANISPPRDALSSASTETLASDPQHGAGRAPSTERAPQEPKPERARDPQVTLSREAQSRLAQDESHQKRAIADESQRLQALSSELPKLARRSLSNIANESDVDRIHKLRLILRNYLIPFKGRDLF